MNRRDFMKGALSFLPVPFIARAASLYLPPEKPKVIVPEGKLFGMNDATYEIWTSDHHGHRWHWLFRKGADSKIFDLERSWVEHTGAMVDAWGVRRGDDT